MDALFSCRNCIHNSSQSLNIGSGWGYCLKHESLLSAPAETTCKYLHRKDLPLFVVDEGVREHASEFATFSGLVSLHTKQPTALCKYSEKYAWEHGTFDPVLHALAQYRKTSPSWVFIQALSGGLDGRRSLAHAGLVRRYLDKCATWKSVYRLMLALLREIPVRAQFADSDLNAEVDAPLSELHDEAAFDVLFTRIAGVQEYGFHSGIERLMWATDELNGGLSALDWNLLIPELTSKCVEWAELLVQQASEEGVFFPSPAATFDDEDSEVA